MEYCTKYTISISLMVFDGRKLLSLYKHFICQLNCWNVHFQQFVRLQKLFHLWPIVWMFRRNHKMCPFSFYFWLENFSLADITTIISLKTYDSNFEYLKEKSRDKIIAITVFWFWVVRKCAVNIKYRQIFTWVIFFLF